VGSKTFDGVWFLAYVHDHSPPHVHGKYAGTTVILDLDFMTREVRLSDRRNRIQPSNAKRSDVNRIRQVADEHAEELFALWEAARV
jgi:hypothetical protein